MRLSQCFFIITLVIAPSLYSNNATRAWNSPEMGTRELSEKRWVELEKERMKREAENNRTKMEENTKIVKAREAHWEFWDTVVYVSISSIIAGVIYKCYGISKK